MAVYVVTVTSIMAICVVTSTSIIMVVCVVSSTSIMIAFLSVVNKDNPGDVE